MNKVFLNFKKGGHHEKIQLFSYCGGIKHSDIGLRRGRGGGGVTPASRGPISSIPIAITAVNAKSAAVGAYGAVQGPFPAAPAGVVVEGTATRGSGRVQMARARFERVAALRGVPLSAAIPTGVIPAETTPCATSGTTTFTFIDADNNGFLSAGDTMTSTDTNCVEFGLKTNGVMSTKLIAISGVGTDANPLLLKANITFTNAATDNGTEVLTTNGGGLLDASSAATQSTLTLSGSLLTLDSSTGWAADIRDFVITEKEGTVNTLAMSLTYDDAEGRVIIATPTILTLAAPTTPGAPADHPVSGVMTVTGAGGSVVTLTASPDGVHVHLAVDTDGAGPIPSQVLPDATWAEM